MTKAQRKCHRKVRHETKGAALSAVINMRKKGKHVRAYYCKHCKGWHVGSTYREAKVMEAFHRLDLKRKTIPNYV